jgi:hypothetical protein
MLAHLRWRWSLSGREGLGSSLPPAELARQDSGVFEELKWLFSTTPEVGKETEANWGHRSDRTLDRTLSLFDRTRPVSVQHLRVFLIFDRTRWCVRSQSTGRVRSFRELTGLQPDAGSMSGRCFVGARLRLDQRVRSVTEPARPVVLRAFGPRDERVRSVLRKRRHCAIGASGQFDQRVRSAWLRLFQVPNSYIRRGTSINTRWPAQGSLLHSWHTYEHFELSNSPLTHLSCFFVYSKWDWVIQVHLHCEIASSWHLVIDLLRDSCFS